MFVYQELRGQASWYGAPARFFHPRDKDGAEVDIVIEADSRSVVEVEVEVEVKATATVVQSDFRGLRKLASAAVDRFSRGVVLYDGETIMHFGDRLYSVPVRRLWEAA